MADFEKKYHSENDVSLEGSMTNWKSQLSVRLQVLHLPSLKRYQPWVDDADLAQLEVIPENLHQEVHVVNVFGDESLQIAATNDDLELEEESRYFLEHFRSFKGRLRIKGR